jgi:membrane protein
MFALRLRHPESSREVHRDVRTGIVHKFTLLATVKQAVADFLADDVLTLSGALTFSTMLSFAPILLLALWAASALGFSAQDSILRQIGELAGDDARLAAQAVIDSVNKRSTAGDAAGIAGILVAIAGATTVFAQLQTSLNDIWRVQYKSSGALWGWIRHRLLSIGLLAAVAFVMTSSLLMSAGFGLLLGNSGWLWDIVNQAITAVVFSALFAGLFRYLPDARLGWRLAVGGGFATAVLFAIGKAVIGLYLAHGSIGGAYGAAGSLVVLLVWVYYSSAIFFFGAELVKGWLTVHGHPLEQPIAGPRHR